MEYHKIAYGSFYDIEGRVWSVNLYRNQESAVMARELTFDADSPAVVEWGELDPEEPIQGSSLTLRIISEADREWVSLYTVEDGGVVAEITLEGKLWWRGSLDPEAYEEPYEKAKDYTVELRFTDFAPLKRHPFQLPGSGGLITAGPAIGANLLAVGTVSALDDDGLPANIDISSLQSTGDDAEANLDKYAVGERAFREDSETKECIKAWDAVSALLTAARVKMVQRNGKIVVYRLDRLSNATKFPPAECVWSSNSQTLSADRMASRVTVTHKGDEGDSMLLPFKTGREEDEESFYATLYHYQPAHTGDENYQSFTLRCYKKSTWEKSAAWRQYFKTEPILDNVSEAEGWVMYCDDSTNQHPALKTLPAVCLLNTHKNDLAQHTDPVCVTPETYIHMVSQLGSQYRIRILQEMLFDGRYNPFSDSDDNYGGNNDVLKNVQLIHVLCRLVLRTGEGKKYYASNRVKIGSNVNRDHRALCLNQNNVTWSETPDWFWLQYRKKEGYKKDEGIVGGGWMANRAAIPVVTAGEDYKKTTFPKFTQELPDGEYVTLPPERGWLSVEVYPVISFDGGDVFPVQEDLNNKLSKFRWMLAKGMEVSMVCNYQTPEKNESEVTVICNNGAEDEVELSPLLGSGGGFNGGATTEIDTGGQVIQPGAPELATARDIASQLCMRRTMLSGEAYIATGGEITFTERLQTGRVFRLVSERMDLRMGFGDRVITELVRTDIEGLEVRRNNVIVQYATPDRGGRDGRDAESYSIIPTATSVGVKAIMAVTSTGALKQSAEYVPKA